MSYQSTAHPTQQGVEHRWRLTHYSETGLRTFLEVDAPTNAQACAWAEQLHGPARALSCIRLTKARA